MEPDFILLPAVAYILGSVPFGLILTRIFTSRDIRKEGSGNIGATNVRRIAGSVLGVLTLAGDMLKGAIPLYIARLTAGTEGPGSEILLFLVSLFAVLGHLYPIFTKFGNGGKGVATAAGCFLIIAPIAFAAALLVFILVVWLTGRASAGSLAGAAILPFAVWGAIHSEILTGCAVMITILIYLRHKENIRRLVSGTEPRV